MTERQSHEGTRPRDTASRTGRRIVTAVFWCIALYLVVVGFYSIPMQVFSPERAAHPPSDSCAGGIDAMRTELLDRAGARISAGGVRNDDSLRDWLSDWDLRHVALQDRCGGEGAELHAALGRMRHRMEMSLRRFDREQAPMNREIDRGLRTLTSTTQRDL